MILSAFLLILIDSFLTLRVWWVSDFIKSEGGYQLYSGASNSKLRTLAIKLWIGKKIFVEHCYCQESSALKFIMGNRGSIFPKACKI
jgi:hypothetical protein